VREQSDSQTTGTSPLRSEERYRAFVEQSAGRDLVLRGGAAGSHQLAGG
jgi:hypothetical protein